ncbi:MAG TPA: helix-turn-helix transcriptional regulator [Bacteroidales bacterium]|nr:helix-turn-helix transcriptional regulator [Bacteroidales bacterium]
MNERIREFLISENKSSAQLAEEIGVQPSGISHILSGRNNPSLDFVLKMLEKYQFLSNEWLLFGKGSMYKDNKEQTLFEENAGNFERTDAVSARDEHNESDSELQESRKDQLKKDVAATSNNRTRVVEKIVWFYDNNSFEEYFPTH